MPIIGKAEPRSEDIVDRVAAIVGCEPAVIDAIIRIETQADAFDPSKRLVARPEARKLASCPYLTNAERKRAAKLGLTKPPKLIGYHIDPVRAGNSAWQWIDKVTAEFGEETALWCSSFGSPQIMGFNHTLCKYSSPSSMVRAFANSEDDQFTAMGAFLLASGLKDACRQRKWKVIARLYNGPKYAQNAYDAKLEKAYEESSAGKENGFIWPEDDVLEMGESGPAVKDLQSHLRSLGYFVAADGDFGPETRDAVRALQFRLGITVDGKVGPETRKAMASATPKEAPSTPVAQVIKESGTAKAAVAQIATGITGGAVAGLSAATTPPATTAVPTVSDVEGILKMSEQGIGLATKILAIGVDKLLIALSIGAIIFGGIALYRRLDAHYKRKIG